MTPEKIISMVSEASGVPVGEILSPSRRQECVVARAAAMILMKRTGLTNREIGYYLGGRDASTVSVMLAKEDPLFLEMAERAEHLRPKPSPMFGEMSLSSVFFREAQYG